MVDADEVTFDGTTLTSVYGRTATSSRSKAHRDRYRHLAGGNAGGHGEAAVDAALRRR
jgi:hypothetical protein